jgi:hypothetical protein
MEQVIMAKKKVSKKAKAKKVATKVKTKVDPIKAEQSRLQKTREFKSKQADEFNKRFPR